QDVGAMAAQALRAEAGLVAELLDDLLHPVHRGLGDAPSPIDDLRDSGHRDAGRTSDVRHFHALRDLHASDDRGLRAAFRKRYRYRLTAGFGAVKLAHTERVSDNPRGEPYEDEAPVRRF